MRCYSEREVRAIVVKNPEFAQGVEKSVSEAEDPFDVIQVIAELEFEMKFEVLLRSIALRLPRL